MSSETGYWVGFEARLQEKIQQNTKKQEEEIKKFMEDHMGDMAQSFALGHDWHIPDEDQDRIYLAKAYIHREFPLEVVNNGDDEDNMCLAHRRSPPTKKRKKVDDSNKKKEKKRKKKIVIEEEKNV